MIGRPDERSVDVGSRSSLEQQWTCGACHAVQQPGRRCVECGVRMLPPGISAATSEREYTLSTRRSLPRLDSDPARRLHVVGVHGGAGESTVSSIVPGSVEASGTWPVEPVEPGQDAHPTPVVLVARTHAHGLLAARAALEEWAFGEVFPVEVVGLVLVADVPGRRPRVLRELESTLADLAPRIWNVPYLRSLRLAENSAQAEEERFVLVPIGLDIFAAAHPEPVYRL